MSPLTKRLVLQPRSEEEASIEMTEAAWRRSSRNFGRSPPQHQLFLVTSPIYRTRSFKRLFIGVCWRFQSRWLPWLVSGVLQTLRPALHESLSLPFFHTLRISLWSRSFPYTTYSFLSPKKELNKNQKMPSHIFGGVHKWLRANILYVYILCFHR